MGNRAVIAFEAEPAVGIYLHWNGGPESVLAFLAEAKRRKLRSNDISYGLARLAQVIGEFFSYPDGDHECSLGVGALSNLDCNNGDNGVYWLGPDWVISRREHASGAQEVEALTREERDSYNRITDWYMDFASHQSEGLASK